MRIWTKILRLDHYLFRCYVGDVNIFFSGDNHFEHDNIRRYCNRPFSSVEEMNEELVRRHNVLVKPEDVVIDVGDFSLDTRVVQPFLKRLNGRRILIAGNHDSCHPCHRRFEKWNRIYREWGFIEVLLAMELKIGDQIVRIEHFPYSGDHTETERYTEFRPKDDGRWLLHGHIHEIRLKEGRQINVGVDQWAYAPVSFEEIADLIKNS
jgi:calcineurin-like phosphoesterase family protein